MIRKYRKKPVVIEAMQYRNVCDLGLALTFLGDSFKSMRENSVTHETRLEIITTEGNIFASEGDWLIKGVKSEFYPCKPDIFEATYTLEVNQ